MLEQESCAHPEHVKANVSQCSVSTWYEQLVKLVTYCIHHTHYYSKHPVNPMTLWADCQADGAVTQKV